jgi:hypothetical protein
VLTQLKFGLKHHQPIKGKYMVLSPQDKIKLYALSNLEDYELPSDITDVAELYDEVSETRYDIADILYEMREGEFETNIPTSCSRHYESKSVATKMLDGSWVGWTYWYGGGKHGCPEEIEWIEDAYDLICSEEEKMVAVRTFTMKK